ncbi:alpha/beta hydrolase [Desulfovibrio sp. OttesenSCG-928-C14]|nr:alpha/beta hydrolase [Desulfovibrio sp. OttesenSCG-928-C14]
MPNAQRPKSPYIRPDVKAFLDQINANPAKFPENPDPVKMRAAPGPEVRAKLDLPLGELALDKMLELPGPGGTPLGARLFDCRAGRGPGPLLLYFHGGGFVVCSSETHASICAEISRQMDLPVLSLDYRLAPEHPWPTAHDDAEHSARFLAENPALLRDLGYSVTGLILGGDSAGANLALVTSIALRDNPAALPVLAQLLFFPAPDMENRNSASFGEFSSGYMMSPEALAFFGRCSKADPASWRASPIKAELSLLPPTVLAVSGLDPFRDQGRALAQKLAESETTLFFHELRGVPHAWITNRRVMPSTQKDLSLLLAALKAMLA